MIDLRDPLAVLAQRLPWGQSVEGHDLWGPTQQLGGAPRVRWSDIKQGQKVAPRELAPSFAHGDDALQIRVDGRELQFVNRSSVYLEVREVSCYVDGEIGTRRWSSVEDQLSLPPMGQLKHPIRQSDVCRDAAACKLFAPLRRLRLGV